jgi:uncharacterized membrane protein YidH (DUF202 family)
MNILAATDSSHHSSVGLLVVGIAFILIGGLQAVNPSISWRASRWQYKNKQALEPSAAGLLAVRIGGLIALVVGIVLIVVGATR